MGNLSPDKGDRTTFTGTLFENKVCMITGATGGIGKVSALAVAKLGFRVLLVCRDHGRGVETREKIVQTTGNNAVELFLCDLSSLESVRSFVKDFESKHDMLHVLVNSAAVFVNKRTLTAAGLELMFATNHLGPFLLTNLLLSTMKRSSPSRILTLSAPSTTELDFQNLQSERKFGAFKSFGASKTCNLLFTYELARRLDGTGVTANVIHPGLVRSNLMKNAPAPVRWITYLISRSPKKAAETIAYYASSPDVEGTTGTFFKGRNKISPSPYSSDRDVQARLWKVSEELAGLT